MEDRKLSHHLVPGLELAAVFTLPDADGDIGVYQVGRAGITRIYVVEEPGPMSMLPWARVEHESQPPALINLQHVEQVRLAEETA
ncbi:hypothetical protein [Algiphilus aromaticivorans]|uniref:hypothetical protein n=1 Tax=Algiphilus aromaticivorans TaxID=382454 RepID=UPI0005C18951|nr:hypothetical protein [Algiphilus aromaticivorans]